MMFEGRVKKGVPYYINTVREDNSIVYNFAIVGVEKEDVNVYHSRYALNIDVNSKNKNYNNESHFTFNVNLNEFDLNSSKASLKNGVLSIILKKADISKNNKILLE